MEKAFDVSDSTDWKDTAIPTLVQVDAGLRCQVCKDFYTSAVITSCSHTFCSLCIRRCLAADGKCPTCRASEQEVRLRKNVALQEVADAFVAARAQALEVATRKEEADTEDGASADPRGIKRKRRSREAAEEGMQAPRRSQRRKVGAAEEAAQSVTIIDNDDQDQDYTAETVDSPDDGLVACPICRKRMKDELVFSHLDLCGSEEAPSRSAPRKSQSQTTTTIQRAVPPPAARPPPERLPALNYSLLKDNALRKKLSELNIASFGPKPLLVRRHLEWVALWNANCDSARPHSRTELKADLDQWERTQGGHAPSGAQSSAVMNKDFDGVGWARKNKDDFEQLITRARRQDRNPTPTSAVEDDHADQGQHNAPQSDGGTTNSEKEMPPPSGPGASSNDIDSQLESPSASDGIVPSKPLKRDPPLQHRSLSQPQEGQISDSDPSSPPPSFVSSGELTKRPFFSMGEKLAADGNVEGVR